MNPLEEFLAVKESSDKTAGWISDMARSFAKGVTLGTAPEAAASAANRFGHMVGNTVTTGAALAGIGAAGSGVYSAGKALAEKINKPRQYEAMLQSHPTLQGEDEEKTRRYFDSLHHVSPTMAGEPLLAGSFVRNMMAKELEGGPAVPMETIKMMSEIQKNVAQGRGGGDKNMSPFTMALMSAGKANLQGGMGKEQRSHEDFTTRYDKDRNEIGSERFKREYK
jgi:hypothetical protein